MTSVLIVGSGAREHALAWKLRRSPDVDRLYVAPGNTGTRLLAENVPLAVTDLEAIARLVEERDIQLTVIGPEAPLAAGLADRLRASGRKVVGPDAMAARIESSKAFAKGVMERAGVPTARYAVFDEPAFALRHLMEADYPLVVKADGLAAGKGVVVCKDQAQARAAIEAMMVNRIHGAAGDRVVIEEALAGPEISLLAFVDGKRVVPLPVAQDHKRLLDGDAGPNTGGMGAYAPVPGVDSAETARLVDLVIRPTVEILAAIGVPYRGILFAGLMLTADGPRVLEYNCRLGDPEAQAILPLLSGDLLPWLQAVASGNLEGAVPTSGGAAAGIVLASPGYPDRPETGAAIEGLDAMTDDVLVFHAGTALDVEGNVITAGGRVLTVVGIGATVEEAARKAYAAPVRFEGMQRRGDIGVPSPPSPLTQRVPDLGRGGESIVPVGLPLLPEWEKGAGGMRGKSRIGMLASGEGSNLQAVIDSCADGIIDAEIAVVVSHNPEARALDRAERAGIPTFAVPTTGDRRDWGARRRHEERLLEVLAPFDLDLLVLAGWMRILSADFLERCGCPAINVHPALLERSHSTGLPILRGAHAVRHAIDLGLRFTGVSVHVVTPEVDAGPVVVSEPVDILPDDDEESLYRRIKAVEHRLLPRAIRLVTSQNSPDANQASQPQRQQQLTAKS
jgi:phosphoribosylamine---glycine ligase